MAKKFSEKIYSSQKWKRLRKQIAESNFYICQMCGRPFSSDDIIIHHITHINQDNVDDPNVTFNSDNLCCVCRSCHAKIHRDDYRKKRGRNILFDADGNIIGIGENTGENHGEDGNECRHK